MERALRKISERVHKNSSYLNGKSTVGTTTRVKDTSTISGTCPICIHDCPVLCEISLSAFRGREALYPEPNQFGSTRYLLDRNDLMSLSERATEVTGIPKAEEVEKDAIERILK